MKTSLEIEIENCTQEIDYILFSNCLEEGTYIDKMVAHYLDRFGRTEWVCNDDVSGPQLNEISEKALTRIANHGMVYQHTFRIVPEMRNGTKYFKVKMTNSHETMLNHDDLNLAKDIPIKMLNSELNSPDYKN